MSANLAAFCYLVAGALFILALRGLSNPETSRRGNLFGMIGMAIAVATTLAAHPPSDAVAWGLVVLSMGLGGGIGALIAQRVANDLDAGARRRVPLTGRHGGGASRGRCSLRAGGVRYRRRRHDP